MIKQVFAGIAEDDDIYAERKRLGDLVEQNRRPSSLYILIEDTPLDDVTGLADRLERAEAEGDLDALIDEATSAGVPGFRR
ncbi:hypothetical protein ASG19_14115 [Rhizobium sp. Leaf306]|uniref:hypothetical protein n=1 Tax=Rhizobium sp. Leaf306 TaxID=1736330 RepID=UPI00071597B5|nr:hypothetical protein [Rhizobium sp. Leaf306]KQQ34894.1 hypothetical protein ASG19_14115 [Rhizobium sp. Leaf306]